MPFKNQDQREACWAQKARDEKAGRKPKWDCEEWEKETPSNIPGMKKESSSRFVSAFQDELSKLSSRPKLMTAAQRLAQTKKPPVKKV